MIRKIETLPLIKSGSIFNTTFHFIKYTFDNNSLDNLFWKSLMKKNFDLPTLIWKRQYVYWSDDF